MEYKLNVCVGGSQGSGKLKEERGGKDGRGGSRKDGRGWMFVEVAMEAGKGKVLALCQKSRLVCVAAVGSGAQIPLFTPTVL